MQPLRFILDRLEPMFQKGGRLEKLYPVYEVIDVFFYTTDAPTPDPVHVRDSMEFKRMMSTVLVALVPCTLMAMYNTGLQANQAMAEIGTSAQLGWRNAIVAWMHLGHDPSSIIDCFFLGALYFVPLYIVTMAVGLAWEILFSVVRGHEVNEGFFVTGLLFPLTLPATIPWWQVAVGITFGVVVAKEVFGGTGRNFLNPALAARAFLFFAYPAQISGNAVWVAVDGYSGATALSAAAAEGIKGITAGATWGDAFWGTMAGSMGETSAVACLVGAVILLVTGIGSWRIMLSMLLGALGLSTLFYFVGSESNPMFSIPPHWHLVLGGFAFGLVFMATDPVTGAMTNVGQFIYGAIIGSMVILIRVINPAYPEGVMLAILFGNIVAPTIDYYVVRAHIRRRALRHV